MDRLSRQYWPRWPDLMEERFITLLLVTGPFSVPFGRTLGLYSFLHPKNKSLGCFCCLHTSFSCLGFDFKRWHFKRAAANSLKNRDLFWQWWQPENELKTLAWDRQFCSRSVVCFSSSTIWDPQASQSGALISPKRLVSWVKWETKINHSVWLSCNQQL